MMKTFREKTDIRTTNSFKFYIPTAFNAQPLALEEKGNYLVPPPDLVPGEIVVTEAHKVLLFPTTADKKKGIMGNLFVTNFRIFLVPTDGAEEKEPPRQKNLLIGEYGVCLTNIDTVFQISGGKNRKLFFNTTITGQVKWLQLCCKNMRVMTLSFEQSPRDHGSSVAKTVLHHAFPGRHSLLFAYDHKTLDDIKLDVAMFSSQRDWEEEIKRTYKDNQLFWRVSVANCEYALSTILPKWIIVPKTILDGDLLTMSRSFRLGRAPTWTWSHANGAALVRMADCLPAITVRTQENKYLEILRAQHPSKKSPKIMELDKRLPVIRDIQTSYCKLRELCMPGSKRQFEMQDAKFYLSLENSKWMNYVSLCLSEAVEACQFIRSGVSVVLQEGDGRDTSAVVSSLVQLMLDADRRSISGFQSLIQKEWISLGHPFSTRLGLIRDIGNEQSPVFLLFLDCVWQLQRQFPTAFEFSETYLTTVFDSCHISVFDTFIFDCERDRLSAIRNENLLLRSVWNWSIQFSDDDIAYFTNPLYQVDDLLDPRSPKRSAENILPNYEIQFLELWQQCYFRWCPLLGIPRGGSHQVDLINRYLRQKIDASLLELKDSAKKTLIECAKRRQKSSLPCSLYNKDSDKEISRSLDSLLIKLQGVNDNYYPFSCCDVTTCSFLADSSVISELDQSVLNLTD